MIDSPSDFIDYLRSHGIDVSTRLKNVLINQQITSQTILQISPRDFKRFPNAGRKTCEEFFELQSAFLHIQKLEEPLRKEADGKITYRDLLFTLASFLNDVCEEHIFPSDIRNLYLYVPLDDYINHTKKIDDILLDINCVDFLLQFQDTHAKVLRRLQAILEKHYELTIDEATELLASKNAHRPLCALLIKRLVQLGEIGQTSNGTIRLLTLSEAIDAGEFNLREKELFKAYFLEGKNYTESGINQGISKERVRQILKSIPQKLGKTIADSWLRIYTSYVWDPDIFMRTTTLEPSDIRYLRYCLKINPPDSIEPLPQLAALNDTSIPKHCRERLLACLKEHYWFIDGEIIEKKRSPLVEYTLKKYCRDTVSFEFFLEKYKTVLHAAEVPATTHLDSEHTLIAMLQKRHSVLWKHGVRLRYFLVDAVDIRELAEKIHLFDYKDIEISTQLFVRKYPEVLAQFDIRDADELQNLIMKRAADLPEIKFNDVERIRMPHLKFGQPNRKKQMIELLQEMATENKQITVIDFARRYEEVYGVDYHTLIGTGLPELQEFYVGKYLSPTPHLAFEP